MVEKPSVKEKWCNQWKKKRNNWNFRLKKKTLLQLSEMGEWKASTKKKGKNPTNPNQKIQRKSQWEILSRWKTKKQANKFKK